MKFLKMFGAVLLSLCIALLPCYKAYAADSVASYDDFDSSSALNFNKALECLKASESRFYEYDHYLICNVKNDTFRASAASEVNAKDIRAVYTVMLYDDGLAYTSEYYNNKLDKVSFNKTNFVRAYMGYITYDEDGQLSFHFSFASSKQMVFYSNGHLDGYAPYCGFVYDSDFVFCDYLSNGVINLDGEKCIIDDFFQVARLTRITGKTLNREILPVGILVLCSVVLVILLVKFFRQSVRAFRL